jgi:hypothetical protein
VQEWPKAIAGWHCCATMSWDRISARIAQDATTTLDHIGATTTYLTWLRLQEHLCNISVFQTVHLSSPVYLIPGAVPHKAFPRMLASLGPGLQRLLLRSLCQRATSPLPWPPGLDTPVLPPTWLQHYRKNDLRSMVEHTVTQQSPPPCGSVV